MRPGQRHARTAANARWRERAEGNGKLAELRAAGVQGDGDGSDASSAAYCEDAGRATQVLSGGGAAPGDEGSWFPAFRRWQVARHAWVETHPDSELGDMLDVLRGEVQVKRGSWEWVP